MGDQICSVLLKGNKQQDADCWCSNKAAIPQKGAGVEGHPYCKESWNAVIWLCNVTSHYLVLEVPFRSAQILSEGQTPGLIDKRTHQARAFAGLGFVSSWYR